MGRMNTQSGTCDESTDGKISRMFERFTNSRKMPKLMCRPVPENLPYVR